MSEFTKTNGSEPSASTILRDIENKFPGKWSGKEYRCLCPCHDDHNPSLYISRGEKWPIVAKCQVGCDWRQVHAAIEARIGYSLKPQTNLRALPKAEIKALYDYSWGGKYQFQKIRYVNKKQFFKHFDDNGQEVWKKPKCPVFLYQQDKLDRLGSNKPVIVCEGEKDCDNLNRILGDDYIAVTNWNGADGWTIDHAALIVGRRIIIAEDNDPVDPKSGKQPGPDRTKKIISLGGYSELLGILKFTDSEVGEKGDVSDWLARGHTEQELRDRLISGLALPTEEVTPGLSDTGNAQILINLFGEKLRYSYELEAWFCWNGRYWENSNALPVEYAKRVCRHLLRDAASMGGDGYKELARHALASENSARIKAMLKLAESIPGVAVKLEDLDTHPFLLNVQNGTINLKTGELCPFDPLHLITRIIDIPYNPADIWTEAEEWFNFLCDIFEGEKEGGKDLLDYVQRVAGYALTGDISERKIFFLWGEGRNGKSTFVNAISHILGEDYSRRMPTSTVLKKRNEAIPNDVAQLKSIRLAYTSETPEGRELDESFVKDASGGEKVPARFMRGEWFSFKPEFKMWLSTNHKPEIHGADAAIWDRIALIPFKFRILEGDIDQKLGEKLQKEARFILKWAVLGCISWQKRKLSPPKSVIEATEVYKKEMNHVKEFIDECCIKDASFSIKVADLLEAFKKFSGISNITLKKFNKLVMAEEIDRPVVGAHGYARWNGLGIKE